MFPAEGSEEHADLSKALCQVREVIAAVDLSVSEYERHQRLQEVCGRMENRSAAKLKNGHTFRKQDMMRPGQVLQHQGVLLWKSATGRLKGEPDKPAVVRLFNYIYHHCVAQHFTRQRCIFSPTKSKVVICILLIDGVEILFILDCSGAPLSDY